METTEIKNDKEEKKFWPIAIIQSNDRKLVDKLEDIRGRITNNRSIDSQVGAIIKEDNH